MKQKIFFNIAGTIFLVVSLLHLMRAILSIPVLIGLWNVSIWFSWGAFIISGYLSYEAFRLGN